MEFICLADAHNGLFGEFHIALRVSNQLDIYFPVIVLISFPPPGLLPVSWKQ